MKRMIIALCCLAILLAGCKQEGFETDIDLRHSSSSSSGQVSQSEDAGNSNPSQSESSVEEIDMLEKPVQIESDPVSDADMQLSSSPLSDAEMTSIFGITWDQTAASKLADPMADLGINLPQISLYRACYLLGLNPMHVSSVAGWYSNTGGEMFLYFTFPDGYQSEFDAAFTWAKNELVPLMQSSVTEEDDKTRFAEIRCATSSNQAYLVIPGGWYGETFTFRDVAARAVAEDGATDFVVIQEPPFNVSMYAGGVESSRLIADQAESIMISTFGFPDRGLGEITGDMDPYTYFKAVSGDEPVEETEPE